MSTNTDASSSRTRRRAAAISIAAGLLGGGAIGLIATMPSVTSAGSPATTTPAQNDEAQNDVAARPDPTERIRESLQALVDDDTITADQADAVAEHLAANRPDGGPGGRPKGGPKGGPGDGGLNPEEMKAKADEFAHLLGLSDGEALRTEFESGKTIAHIAEANGVDIQTVKNYMLEQVNERLDAAVAAGKIDQATADEKRAEAESEIDDKVNSTDPRPGPGPGPSGPRGPQADAGNGQGGPNIVAGDDSTDA